MIGLTLETLAAEYGVKLADSDGYDLSAASVRSALLVVMAATRDDLRTMVARLEDRPGSPCPQALRPELRAAAHALKCVERDIASLLPRKCIETTGEAASEVA